MPKQNSTLKTEYGSKKMKEIGLFGSWLTVNRRCNFRCMWCYGQGTDYKPEDDMDLDLALKLINLEAGIGIQSVILIGGEPTLWPHIFTVSRYIKAREMNSFLVTNGFLFSSERFMKKVAEFPFDNVTISLKAGNPEQYRKLTGVDAFEQVLSGIHNLREGGHNFDISITLSSLIAGNLSELVKTAVDAGAKGVKIEFCAATFKGNDARRGYMMSPSEVVKCIMRHYETMNLYTEGRLMIEQSLPFCLWPADFLARLKEKNQIISGCHVLRREGIIFDPHGKVIQCNGLYEYPLGKFGIDFKDPLSFAAFWMRPDVVNFYNKLIAYPSQQCIKCLQYNECGGGCPLQWFVFNPEEIIPKRR